MKEKGRTLTAKFLKEEYKLSSWWGCVPKVCFIIWSSILDLAGNGLFGGHSCGGR